MTKRKLKFGKNAKHTNWGRIGCSHGMLFAGGYDYWIFGIKGLIAFEIMSAWGNFIDMFDRF